jgi:hypothetical protein
MTKCFSVLPCNGCLYSSTCCSEKAVGDVSLEVKGQASMCSSISVDLLYGCCKVQVVNDNKIAPVLYSSFFSLVSTIELD